MCTDGKTLVTNEQEKIIFVGASTVQLSGSSASLTVLFQDRSAASSRESNSKISEGGIN